MGRTVEPLHTIDVWQCSLTVAHTQHWQLLDNAEKNQAEKFTQPLLRQYYITAHGHLRTILARYVGVTPDSLRIAKAAHGKPYLVDYPELAFNLSHTDNLMVLAVAEQCQLGIDIERCQPRPRLAALVKKCFSEAEAAYWQQLPAAQQQQVFYQFWTRKEAFVKATGFGITVGLRDCVLNPENANHFLAVPACCGLASDWQCQALELNANVCASIVVDKAMLALRTKNIF